MPTLLIDLLGKRKRVKVGARASLGRAESNDVSIDHPAVSRTHLRIEAVDGTFIVEDAGSANGTVLNGKRVRGRHLLQDGARLAIGPATITFHTDDAVIDTAQPEQAAADVREGILLNCSCGARLWVPDDRIGGIGKCRQCGAQVSLGQKQMCSICQWEITADALKQRCPDCGLTFHAECWQANRGCSAYGCGQVNVLGKDPASASKPGAAVSESQDQSDHVPWEDSLLTASIAASFLGLITFGVPPLMVGALAVIYALRHRAAVSGGRPPRVAGCVIIASVGLLAGIVVSGYWWLGWTLR